MPKIVIEGQRQLKGEIKIHGAKNSALPVLASTILCKGESVIHNCPKLTDSDATIKILEYLGCKVKREGSTVIVNSQNINKYDVPDHLMREMRSSIVFLGAIVSRTGKTKLSLPGGCELGPRPIDLHLKALKQMGLHVEESGGYLSCSVPNKKLKGTEIALSFPSVGATENILLAACLADGVTIITNAAREPEIVDLADFLNSCGASIQGAGEGIIRISGVKNLSGATHTVIPDRIVAATFMSACAITKGEMVLKNIIPDHLNQIIPMFEEAGCKVTCNNNSLKIKAPNRLNPIKIIRTMPYPGFPTDAQAPIMAMTSLSNGTSMFIENIFENRYKHVGELLRLGANIKVEGKVSVVEGVRDLVGAPIQASDLRGAASLIVAGLAAKGTTTVRGLHYLDRGYENIEDNLNLLGAKVKRV